MSEHEDKKGIGSGRLMTSNAFEEALKELENARPVPKKAAPEQPKNSPALEPPKSKPVTDIEALRSILNRVDHAEQVVEKFRKDHPYLVAPNILGLWEVSLKETTVMLQRELDRIMRERGEGQ